MTSEILIRSLPTRRYAVIATRACSENMSEIENQCLDGGLLVGMEATLPEDPAIRYTTNGQWVGCNRIFCRTCRAWVRHLDGVRIWAGNQGEAEIRQLYLDENAASHSFFTSRASGLLHRTYLCRCSWGDAAGVKPLFAVDTADGWYCAGHPPTESRG